MENGSELTIDMYGAGRIPIWELLRTIRDLLLPIIQERLASGDSRGKLRELIATERDEFSYLQLVKSHNSGITQIAGDSAVYRVDELLGNVGLDEAISEIFPEKKQ